MLYEFYCFVIRFVVLYTFFFLFNFLFSNRIILTNLCSVYISPQPSPNTPQPRPNTNSQPNPVNEPEKILLSDSKSVHIDSKIDSESESDDNLEGSMDKGASHVEDSDRCGGDELLSDVNEDNISEDVVREIGSEEESDSNNKDQPFRGRAFRFGDDGKIHLEVGQL
ncbi:hypothetical protein ACOSQ2_010469 [Xanthoceras sorbifolium]